MYQSLIIRLFPLLLLIPAPAVSWQPADSGSETITQYGMSAGQEVELRNISAYESIQDTTNREPDQVAPPLDDLIREALTNNPGLESSRLSELAAGERIPQAKSWMPPEIRYQYHRQALGIPGAVDFMTVNTWSLSQNLPFPGKISAKVAIEEANRDMSTHTREDHEVWLVSEVKKTVADLWKTEQLLEVNRDLQGLMTNFVESAERMFEVGLSGLESVLSARTNLARLRTEERTLHNEYEKMRLKMNQLLNRNPAQELGTITALPQETLPGSITSLEERMLSSRPDLLAMQSGIDMKDAEMRAAQREAYPDVMVGVMFMQMPAGMENQLGVMASLKIPVAPWSGSMISGRVNEARHERRSRELALENMTSMARVNLQQALLDLETQLDIIRLYRDEVIPQAVETVESLSGSFQAGRTDYLMVLDSYRTLEMARMDYTVAQADYHKSVAELERQTGIMTGSGAE